MYTSKYTYIYVSIMYYRVIEITYYTKTAEIIAKSRIRFQHNIISFIMVTRGIF